MGVEESLNRSPEFLEPDHIVIQGAPNNKQAQERFDLFQRVYDRVDSDPKVIYPGQYRELVVDFVSEGNENLCEIDPGNTIEEVQELVKRIDEGEKVIFITNEYHRPRTELILDYLLIEGKSMVIGAPPEGEKFSEALMAIREHYKIWLLKLVRKIYI